MACERTVGWYRRYLRMVFSMDVLVAHALATLDGTIPSTQ